MRQKAGVLAVIEELGKLEPLMAEAAVEEVMIRNTKRIGPFWRSLFLDVQLQNDL